MKPFQGVFPVLAIPFLENGQIDEHSLRKEIEFELEQGVDGIVIFGLASEIYKLSEAERHWLIRLTVDHVNGQVPIIAGTEHTGSEVAAERSYQAQELGVSGVMLYPPSFVKPDAAGIKQYYRMVAERLSIPIMIQDAQAWTQVPLSVELLLDLHRSLPAVQYVKVETVPTGPKITNIAERSEGSLHIFGGYGGLYFPDELRRGAIGTLIPAAISDWFLRIHRAFLDGRTNDAEELHAQLLPFLLFEMTTLDALIEIQKRMFVEAGIFKTTITRQPHISLDRHQLETLATLLKKYDFAVLGRAQ